MSENELKVMIDECRRLKVEVGEKSKNLRKLKEELRIFLIDSGLKNYDGVEVRRAFSWDTELFRIENPKLADIYILREERMVVDNILTSKNKKKIKENHPDIYRQYLEEGTARLYGL